MGIAESALSTHFDSSVPAAFHRPASRVDQKANQEIVLRKLDRGDGGGIRRDGRGLDGRHAPLASILSRGHALPALEAIGGLRRIARFKDVNLSAAEVVVVIVRVADMMVKTLVCWWPRIVMMSRRGQGARGSRGCPRMVGHAAIAAHFSRIF